MKKLLLIMTTSPLNKYYYKKDILNTKNNKKWAVKFWNLLGIHNKKVENLFREKGSRILHHKNFININENKVLKKALNKLPKSFFYINYAARSYKLSMIDRLLEYHGGKKVFLNEKPMPARDRNFRDNLNYVLENLGIRIIFRFFQYISTFINDRIKFKIRAKPKIYFVSNDFLFRQASKKKNILLVKKIQNYEYETFFNSSKLKRRKQHILWVDQELDFSFDQKINYHSNPLMPNKIYWSKIEKFLLFIKEKSGINPIVAAGHRRNIYEKPIKNKFFFDKTVELIKDSKIVISHNSLALQMAVLFRKPIILLTIPSMASFGKYSMNDLVCKQFSEETGAKIVNLDDFSYSKNKHNLSYFLKVNNSKYNKFIKKWLNFRNPREVGNWKVILNELDKI